MSENQPNDLEGCYSKLPTHASGEGRRAGGGAQKPRANDLISGKCLVGPP